MPLTNKLPSKQWKKMNSMWMIKVKIKRNKRRTVNLSRNILKPKSA